MDGFAIILARLLTVDLGIDSVTSGISENLEEIVEWIGFVLALSLFDHLPKKIIAIGVDSSCIKRNSFHAALFADWLEANSPNDFWRSSG